MNRRTELVVRPLLAAIVALTLGAAIANAQTVIKPAWNLFSPADDVQIGKESAVQAEQQVPILNDRTAEAYLDRIGQRLAANAGGPKFQYQFKIVNVSDINAFALPGGFVYINRGIIDQAKNEGELAGVVAHEISHVALRHGTHQASKAYAAQAGLGILGSILGGRVGENTAQVLNVVGGLGLNALFLKYGRDLESQADIRGAQIMTASGYTPADMVGFFRTLEGVDSSRKTSWLSDHPAPPDRIARIQKEATFLHVSKTPVTNVAELRSIQTEMRRNGPAPTQKQIADTKTPSTSTQPTQTNQVDAPATTLRTYTSPAGMYRFSFPSNWEVYQDGEAVTLAPRGGVASVGGNNEIIYGAVVNLYDPSGQKPRGSALSGTADQIPLDDATNGLLVRIQQGSPHLKLVRGPEQQGNASGGRALAAVLRGANPNTGIVERVTIVTRQLPDARLVYLLFVTPDKDANRFAGALQGMASSLQVAETQFR